MEADRMDILNRVKSGEISVEEGARRLSEIEGPPSASELSASKLSASKLSASKLLAADASTGEVSHEASGEPVIHEMTPDDYKDENLEHFQNWWLIPFWIGLGIFIFSAGLMSWGFTNAHFFWFYCAWLPLLVGLIVLIGAAWSRTARWLHVRVHESNDAGSHNIRISFPIPTHLAGWALRIAAPRIPEMKDKEWVNTAIPLLETLGNSKEPMVVEVNDKGEKVQVYII